MIKSFNKNYALMGAAFTLGMLLPQAAQANTVAQLTTTSYTNQSFSTIMERVVLSFGGLPGLLSMGAYIMGIVFAIGGVLKIKDHVENPGQTELKAGIIRLIVGGLLFALPSLMVIMTSTVGDQSGNVKATTLAKGDFGFAGP